MHDKRRRTVPPNWWRRCSESLITEWKNFFFMKYCAQSKEMRFAYSLKTFHLVVHESDDVDAVREHRLEHCTEKQAGTSNESDMKSNSAWVKVLMEVLGYQGPGFCSLECRL
mgnify:CR=1 FL=1